MLLRRATDGRRPRRVRLWWPSFRRSGRQRLVSDHDDDSDQPVVAATNAPTTTTAAMEKDPLLLVVVERNVDATMSMKTTTTTTATEEEVEADAECIVCSEMICCGDDDDESNTAKAAAVKLCTCHALVCRACMERWCFDGTNKRNDPDHQPTCPVCHQNLHRDSLIKALGIVESTSSCLPPSAAGAAVDHRVVDEAGREAPVVTVVVEEGGEDCDDSLTDDWITSQSDAKRCPRCHVWIIKTGGCVHMTCARCKHEFCWICLIGIHECVTFHWEEDDEDDDDDDDENASRAGSGPGTNGDAESYATGHGHAAAVVDGLDAR